MNRTRELYLGCTAHGTTHHDYDVPSISEKVRMVKEAGVFDYIDRSPPDEEFRDLLKASERFSLPVRASGWFYCLGRDEALFEQNIIKARLLGSLLHNIQLLTHHADGHVLSDEEVGAFYLWAYEFGMRHGVTPCLEVHVNMWSEHFGRVEKVGNWVEERGVPFGITLDHSHVIFKMDNPREQAVQGMIDDIERGAVILDPSLPGNVCEIWIERNWVIHAHARCAIPNNPVNHLAQHPDGRPGRGIQYPFTRPGPGEFVTDDWEEGLLAPWKAVVRMLLQNHAMNPNSRLGQISCEHIPAVDYGAGHGYSIFDQNVACAHWLRGEWLSLQNRQLG